MSVIISCSGKFHAFALAEQLEKHKMLTSLYTTYAYQKNTLLRRFVKRIDKENIPVNRIHTNNLLAFPLKLLPGQGYTWLNLYDRWVASRVRNVNSKVFIGWSGMSLHAIRAAKATGKLAIVERGSSHILYQNRILHEEYKKFGIEFHIDKRIIEKELKEYEEADYISIPSSFVRNSFLQNGLPENKLVLNPYGAKTPLLPSINQVSESDRPFRIVYLGTLNIRKGLIYLFQALHRLSFPIKNYEVWFIGSIDEALKPTIDKYKLKNWIFFGHIPQAQISQLIYKCDIAVQPSIEEGLSMVIPQLMAEGIPVIITPNTGGENIITDGENGFVIPIQNPEAISDKIELMYNDTQRLAKMKKMAIASIKNGFTWDDYGIRYVDFLKSII